MDQRMQGQVKADLVVKVTWKRVIIQHIKDGVVLKIIEQKVRGKYIDFDRDQHSHNEFENHS